MSPTKQRKTFISYSRTNKEFALKLAKELRSSGFDIWFDQLDIPTGSRWDDEVEHALESSEIFMVILTPASSTSDNVKDEIGYAIDTGKRILPVLLQNANVPLRLRRFQYVDFTNKSFDDGVESAKELLTNLIEESTIPKMPAVGKVQVPDETRQAKEQAAPAGGQGTSSTRTEMLRRENMEQEKRFRAEQAKLLEEKAELEKQLHEKRSIPEKEAEIVRVAPEKKPRSNMLLIGAGAVILLIAAVVGISVLGGGGSNEPPAVEPSTVAAQIEEPVLTEEPTAVPTKPAPPSATTAAVVPTNTKAAAPTTAPAVNVEAQIKKARILVYEDTAAEGLWIEPMLKTVGYAENAKFVHDRIGTLQKELNDAKWDLIIIAAEARSAVTGELWVDVKEQLDAGTPVIIETWTIHRQIEGKIKDILDGCGVQFQDIMDVSVPVQWYVSDSPFFNSPNQVADLSKTNRYWSGEAGDFLKLRPGSDAKILAGTSSNQDESGVIVNCYDGRLILQTFSNHDYPQAQITELWQNFVYNLLSNHFSQ